MKNALTKITQPFEKYFSGSFVSVCQTVNFNRFELFVRSVYTIYNTIFRKYFQFRSDMFNIEING